MNNQSTIVIFEAGVNHNGSLKSEKKLIDVAAGVGAAVTQNIIHQLGIYLGIPERRVI